MGLIYFVVPLILQIGLSLFVKDKKYFQPSILIVIIALYVFLIPAMITDGPFDDTAVQDDMPRCGLPMLAVFMIRAIISIAGTIIAIIAYFCLKRFTPKTE